MFFPRAEDQDIVKVRSIEFEKEVAKNIINITLE